MSTVSTASGSIDASGNANAFGSSHSADRYCIVNVVMTEDRVSAVNYTGRTGDLTTQGEQSAFAVQNCILENTRVPFALSAKILVPGVVW
jgi:hypothetical protein